MFTPEQLLLKARGSSVGKRDCLSLRRSIRANCCPSYNTSANAVERRHLQGSTNNHRVALITTLRYFEVDLFRSGPLGLIIRHNTLCSQFIPHHTITFIRLVCHVSPSLCILFHYSTPCPAPLAVYSRSVHPIMTGCARRVLISSGPR